MNRVINYPGAVPLEADILDGAKNAMLGVGYVAQALLGTGPIVNGLLVTQTASPGLSVLISIGSLYQSLVIDNSGYSSLAADTTGTVVKQGINPSPLTMAAVTLPGGGGLRQICSVQAKIVEQDADNQVLPYYNSANINVALNGPGGSGTPQPRRREVALVVYYKYGTAIVGVPSAPTLDAGSVGLAQFELRSTTTQITAGALSSSNAQITQFNGQADPRLQPPYASLAGSNTFAGTQLFQGNVVVTPGTLTVAPGAGTGQPTTLDQFLATLANPGQIIIPTPVGNLIVKWANVTCAASGAATPVLFSPAFPTACFGVQISPSIATATSTGAWQDTPTAAGFNAHCNGSTTVACQWIAIGK